MSTTEGESMTITPEEIIEFWFSSRVKPLRFRSTPAFDREITEKYYSLWNEAGQGAYNSWQQTPRGALALVIIFDQFPLHMFRGDARSFSTESLAQKVAYQAIKQHFDTELTAEEKSFLYIPFMHSESLADQERSVDLYEAAGLTDNLRWARHHREIIRRFGRFPHRNRVLGRTSTPDEIDYLNSNEAFHG